MILIKLKLHFCKSALIALLIKVFFGTTAYAQMSGTYQVTGNIEGLADQKVYLSAKTKGLTIADSVLAKNGHFEFKGKTPGALVYYLRFGKSTYLSVPIDVNEQVEITGNLDHLTEDDVKGAKMLPVWKEWFKGWETIRSRAGVLYKMLDSIGRAGKDANRSYVDAEFKKLDQRLIDSVEVLVKKYPSSPITPFIIIDRFINYPNPEKAKSTYAALSKAGKNSLYGQELGEALRIASKTGIGVKPDFTMADRNGQSFKLSSLKGKVVLVDFWASWCGPCRKENPNLVKAYAKYHGKGFEIVGVSLDDKKDNWLKAIDADQLGWLHVSDLKGWKSDLAAEYGIRSIPTSFLVDADGKIIAKDLRGDQLEKKLADIFK